MIEEIINEGNMEQNEEYQREVLKQKSQDNPREVAIREKVREVV